jgi:leucyl-tRNA synthetase
LKITEYAERLLNDLDGLDWPESVKEMQRNWIGRSLGAEVQFQVAGADSSFSVFTTRPDTLFGATFCVLAPEHPLVDRICTEAQREQVNSYKKTASYLSDLDRTAGQKEKSGVFLGVYAINPATNQKIPIYIADYVLATYGTGALMAVPGHDERDHAFARKYSLPIVRVLSGGESEDIQVQAHTGDGFLLNSGFLDGLSKDEASTKMISWLESQGLGKGKVQYRLRDWVFSRQRYWGEPIPLLKHARTGELRAMATEDLPLKLPDMDDFKPSPDGDPPLAKAQEWLEVRDPEGELWLRETNTMPQWAGSCWYYLRYLDPLNQKQAWDVEKEKYWMPVDLYVGGVEHAVMHLLYARFWHKVLYDCSLVSTKEPFLSLRNQGMILGENNEKMSKSRGNVVNPDAVIAEWGADSLRLYEMFMGPLEAAKPWQTNGIVGCHRFLQRVWRLLVTAEGKLNREILVEDSGENRRAVHRLTKKVSEDIEAMQFNTAIAAMMEFVNLVYKTPQLTLAEVQTFILLLSPFAPHLGEELWGMAGGKGTLAYESWPTYDADLAKLDFATLAVSINGKLKVTIQIPMGANLETVKEIALAEESVKKSLVDKQILKEVFVPGKILNFVLKG